MTNVNKTTNSLKSKGKIWKAGVYIRLSKEDGNDESLSVQNQRKRLLAFIESNKDEIELFRIYVDDGKSGTNSDREDFQNLLSDIRKRNLDCVVVKDPSRLSRNYIEAGHYMEQLFVEYGIRFISLELPALDSYKRPEEMNSIIVPITNVFNEEHCRQTSIKVRGTFNRKRQDGEFIGAFAPFGYLKDPEDKHHFIVDEEAAKIVQMIYSWYVNDSVSKVRIAKKLNELNIPNPKVYKQSKGLKYKSPSDTDGTWEYTSVNNILNNQMYIGHMVQGRQKTLSYKIKKLVYTPQSDWFIVQNTHEAIISSELFEAAQQMQKIRSRTAPQKNNVYLFSGFLRCYDCKRSMKRGRSKNYIYYSCSTYRNRSSELCTKHSIREDIIYDAVLGAIKTQISLAASFKDIIETVNGASQSRVNSERTSELLVKQKDELNKTNNVMDDSYVDWKRGVITESQYQRIKQKLDEQIERIENAINILEEQQKKISEGISPSDPYLENFLKYKNISRLERNTLIDLIEMIYIHEGGEITVEFKFKDQYQLIMEYIESSKHELKLKKDK